MTESSGAALICFLIYLLAVFVLAILSGRVAKGKEFVGEYFLGSRGFGVWAFALSFAATNASGGALGGFRRGDDVDVSGYWADFRDSGGGFRGLLRVPL